jgi:pimeloyl-ACP methyl ester carboxylesterase
MPRPTHLDVRGTNNELVPHTFWRADTPCRGLGLVLPGESYGPDLPLLYLPRRHLLERGADVMVVRRAYSEWPVYAQASNERKTMLAGYDALSALFAALQAGEYDYITIVAKSLGTLAAARLLGEETVLRSASIIWLTPLATQPELVAAVESWGGRSLFVVGTADPTADPGAIERLRAATGGAVMRIEGANHSLEFDSTARTVAILAEVLAAIALFVDR